MVKAPSFKIEVGGKDITEAISKNLISLSLNDKEKNEADELSLELTGKVKRPSLGSKLKVYLGYDGIFTYMGSFNVETTTRKDNYGLGIHATGVNFSQKIKERKDVTYEKQSIKEICSQIAKSNELNLNCDYEDVFISSKAQNAQSDMAFLNDLAKEYNAIFNIKNDTLIFRKKQDEKSQKKSTLPSVSVDVQDCISIWVKFSAKTGYKSCVVLWQDTQSNEIKEVTVGSGTPVLRHRASIKDPAQAEQIAKAQLAKSNAGVKTGSLKIAGRAVFAGSRLILSGGIDENGVYSVTSVIHELNNTGWYTTINFEN